jgi:hypothetical protein
MPTLPAASAAATAAAATGLLPTVGYPVRAPVGRGADCRPAARRATASLVSSGQRARERLCRGPGRWVMGGPPVRGGPVEGGTLAQGGAAAASMLATSASDSRGMPDRSSARSVPGAPPSLPTAAATMPCPVPACCCCCCCWRSTARAMAPPDSSAHPERFRATGPTPSGHHSALHIMRCCCLCGIMWRG